jgi:hypothetical protein
MHRSSETIGTIAAALAKAQGELTNPEKSLVATITRQGARGGEVEQSFRYAPLSSGLEIVRKTLSQHEIATVQTTAVDQVAGMVNLTTVLAHSSGEWIASDWPVCAISDTAAPHRMGAALTYARRYALFTLVGIAGEDDIDAPDLNAPATASASGEGQPMLTNNRRLKDGESQSDPRSKAASRAFQPIVDPEASAALRDQLAGELKNLGSAEEAATWARRVLGARSSLTGADAHQIEEAFREKLTVFERATDMRDWRRLSQSKTALQMPVSPGKRRLRKSARPSGGERVDKGALAHSEPRRARDREHVRFVTKQPCLICGRKPSDAHHLRHAQQRAFGRKVSDEFTVPLCRGHHREVHRCGDEAAWWQKAGVDPTASARALWLQTHPLPTTEMSLAGPLSGDAEPTAPSSPNYKQTQLSGRLPNDLFQADRGQPPQCF